MPMLSRSQSPRISSAPLPLVVARYIVAVEPLASLDPERLVAGLAPNFQRYLVGSPTD
jgi:hypothetical protein